MKSQQTSELRLLSVWCIATVCFMLNIFLLCLNPQFLERIQRVGNQSNKSMMPYIWAR
ncbi:hypothetical protein BDW71DRAFT_177094 [Aspergillus fruticulosus]